MLEHWNELLTGSPQALRKLHDLTYRDLFSYGILLGYSRDDVKDSIQTMFLQIWEKRDKLHKISAVKPYLFTWLRRTLNEQRLENHKAAFAVESEQISESKEELMIFAEDLSTQAQILKSRFDKLSDRQRQVIELRYFQNLSHSEIAEKTNTSIRNIYNTVSEAIKILRKK